MSPGTRHLPDAVFERLREHIASQLGRWRLHGRRIAIGLSGGLDSVVLLELLAAVAPAAGVTLSALHVHHGLSPNADAWAASCATLAAQRGVPLEVHRVHVRRDDPLGVEAAARAELDEAGITGAKAAAAVMGMNNVYYRFVHLVGDADYQTMPARLRMNVMANPGIDKLDFELYSLAVSAVNGCGLCIESHEKLLRKHEVSREAIQSAVRIAAVIHAVARVLEQAPAAAEVGLAA